MHEIEPFFNWRHKYKAESDKLSPFYDRRYNEFSYDKKIYNYFIHPQWDEIESESLYVKLLFVDYDEHFAIIELFGEWNDGIQNDIMLLRRELIDPLLNHGIKHLILIGENVLNFHAEDIDYYQELYDELIEEDGWIVGLNFREHVVAEMERIDIPNYIQLRDPFDEVKWRPYDPHLLFKNIEDLFGKWLEDGLLQLT